MMVNILAYNEILADVKEMKENEFVNKYLNIKKNLQYSSKMKNSMIKRK